MLVLVGCVNFLSKFEDIEANKTRPIAVVVEPAEAAPGDTVHVKYYGFSPDPSNVSLHWTAVLDFSLSAYGNADAESHYVNLDNMMLPGSKPDDFYFVVPDSTLLYSTYLKGMMQAAWNTSQLTLEQANALLKTAAATNAPLPSPLDSIADMIGAKIKIMVHISAEIQLDVFKYMTIRYSRRLFSPNTNINPFARWIQVCTADTSKLLSFDSIDRHPHTAQYLFSRQNTVNDTVVIDSGKSYFIVADSCIDGTDTLMQQYSYLSLISGKSFTQRENYYYQWFYKDLDYTSSMKYDSLILFQGGNERGNAVGFMPPVDTAMHHFKFYMVMRDSRADFEAVGENEYEVTGYFKYTDRYARNLHK
jgi:hypothetical protein